MIPLDEEWMNIFQKGFLGYLRINKLIMDSGHANDEKSERVSRREHLNSNHKFTIGSNDSANIVRIMKKKTTHSTLARYARASETDSHSYCEKFVVSKAAVLLATFQI